MDPKRTVDKLVSTYICNAIDHGEASRNGDYERANRSHDEILHALKLLTEQGERMRLLELLDHKDASVRGWAATHLLPFREDRARETLQAIVDEGVWPMGFDASIVLQEWAKGTLKVP